MEIIPHSETEKPLKSKPTVKKDYSGNKEQIQNIETEEQKYQIREFLGHIGIKNSPELQSFLIKLLLERIKLDQHFSLYGLTKEEIDGLKYKGVIKNEERILQTQVGAAKSAENLVDQWKAQGYSNYETLQKLLQAHEAGEVTILEEKYADFSSFFQELSAGQYGAKDTKRIIQTINNSGVDLTAPNAFEQVIWTIYEDDNISTVTKEKIREKFKLKSIKTGDDLLDNLKTQRKRFAKYQSQVNATTAVISELETTTKSLKARLKELKKKILMESSLDKRLKLEKEYDQLESLLDEQTKQIKIQKKRKAELADSPPSQNVLVRGLNAEVKEGRIHIQLPKSKRSLSVPSNLGNEAIASTVNAYLVNDILTPLGLESYFFYQSDFTGDYPHPTSIERNDLFLYRLGLAKEGQVLNKADIKKLSKLLDGLMKLKDYQIDKTLHENAETRLTLIGALKGHKLDHEFLASEISNVEQG